jgi:hypothetical protein
MTDITIYIELLNILLLSWVITKFKPIQIILEILPDNILFNMTRLLLTCIMCCSFWLTFCLIGDIYLASLNAFVAFWYSKIFGYWENRIKLN